MIDDQLETANYNTMRRLADLPNRSSVDCRVVAYCWFGTVRPLESLPVGTVNRCETKFPGLSIQEIAERHGWVDVDGYIHVVVG